MTLASYLFVWFVATGLGAVLGWIVRGLARPQFAIQCSWCKEITRTNGVDISHTICPDCTKKVLETM
jgi:hypothetical protein